jgi:prephenate dehydratase
VTEAVQRGEYYYAVVDNRPGVLYELLDHFHHQGVGFYAFTAFPLAGNKSQLDFFPIDAPRFLEAAHEAGVDMIGPRSAFVVQGEDTTGALVSYHQRLAEAGINVSAANGVSDGRGGFGYVLWVKPEDYEKAAQQVGLTP